jgi:hypothetical protein
MFEADLFGHRATSSPGAKEAAGKNRELVSSRAKAREIKDKRTYFGTTKVMPCYEARAALISFSFLKLGPGAIIPLPANGLLLLLKPGRSQHRRRSHREQSAEPPAGG